MKRFAYKVSRKKEKFEARAAKEEREYFDVLQEEHNVKDQERNLKALREDALRAQSELESQAARHLQAQQDLDGLYDSIFQGPTPDFPEEDDRERQSSMTLQSYHEARIRSEAEGHALNSLTEASKRLKRAMNFIEEALDYSRMDMFGGGSISDMMERNALSNAETQVSDAYMLANQAQRASSAVKALPPVRIAQGSIMSDVFFDNIFTDMAFHDKIKASKQELLQSTNALNNELNASKERLRGLELEAKVKSQALETARTDLQKAREEIFERTARQ
jgi:hypothetical protein